MMANAKVPKVYPLFEFELHMGRLTTDEILEAFGRTYSWLNDRRNGKHAFTTEECYTILKLLDKPYSEISKYFPPLR